MVKNQNNVKKKIYSKKRVLRGGEINTTAFIDGDGIHGITKTGFWVDKEKEIEKLTEKVCGTWFSNLRNHPDFNTRALNTDGSVKGTTNGLENIAICKRYESVGNLQKLPVESVDDSDGDGYVVVPKEQPVSLIEQPEMPPKCEELERELSGIYQLLVNTITDKNKKYDTTSVITKVEEVFDSCATKLVKTIETSTSMNVISTICEQISALCQKLIFKTLNPNLHAQSSIGQALKKRGFFIGIEKSYPLGFFTPSFLDIDCHSLKLFDDFLNSLISGINEKNILIQSNISYLPTKRLFLVLLKVGDKYKSSMTRCGIPSISLSTDIAHNFLDSGLPEDVYNLLPYDFSDVGAQQESHVSVEAGGSKSRSRYRRHRKPVRKTHREHKSKSKPKTHRRRSARKNKKYTRKY